MNPIIFNSNARVAFLNDFYNSTAAQTYASWTCCPFQ